MLAYLKPLIRRGIGEVTTRDLQGLIERATASQSGRYHIYSAARAFLRWCVRERLLKHSPLQDAHPPGKKSQSRDQAT